MKKYLKKLQKKTLYSVPIQRYTMCIYIPTCVYLLGYSNVKFDKVLTQHLGDSRSLKVAAV